jgi:DNA-binding Xre family transcriptional regulator
MIWRQEMNINELLKQKNMSKYTLSKFSGVPYASISDICTGKVKIEKCSAGTLYKISKLLGITIEDLIAEHMEYRCDFDTFKSGICHMVKNMGDLDFIIHVLESKKIRKLFQRKWYPESLYLLAMVDYLCRENDLPVCEEYGDIRKMRLKDVVYPIGIVLMSLLSKSEQPKIDSFEQAIPEFKRFNIVENEVRNVC